VVAASQASARDYGPGVEPTRYPDPDILVLDEKRFKAKVGNTTIKRLYTGCLWAEGPAWNAQGQYLVWSDIPANRQLRYLDDDGHISEQFHKPSNEANGNSFDFEGRQISAERTRLVRYEHNGSVTSLAEQANGKPLNGPNDMVVHPNDKSIWFTDPGYGAISIYEGQLAKTGSLQPYQKEAVYRLDTQSGQLSKVADEPFKPNGIAFSHDYKKVYVCDNRHHPLSQRQERDLELRSQRRQIVESETVHRHDLERQVRLPGRHARRRRRQCLGRCGLGGSWL